VRDDYSLLKRVLMEFGKLNEILLSSYLGMDMLLIALLIG
jgi:hypothetical protein